ncbi:MAG: hypothetical protein H6737_19370 [Alphaproteobacteria bacterium]|nr:hypothetical protein [Alphaproteobacteria bacterium]
MTPGLLRHTLAHLAPDASWPDEPEALLAAIERHADAHPGDAVWTQLLLAANDLAVEAPELPGGLRARELVRVDPYSTTWTALDADGGHWLVRTPRPDATPVHRRILERDRRGLAGLVAGLTSDDATLAAPAPGTPLEEASIPQGDVVRVLADALGLLARWREAGLGPGVPHPEELRIHDGRLRIVSLTPSTPGGTGLFDAVVRMLPAMPEGPVERFVEGLRALEPDPAEARALFQRALAEALGQHAVDLRRRHVLAAANDRRGRLHRAVGALARTLQPPSGRGPIGYDLEGRATHVASDGETVTWGAGAAVPLFADGDFDAPEARRFLRACATSPTRPEGADGDPAVTDALGRWVSAGLKLRTVRLLLEKA